MSEYRATTYRCAFCQGKIVSCNCEKGFKSAVEASTLNRILKEVEQYHLAGCMAGTKCDRGLCTCNDIAGIIKELK